MTDKKSVVALQLDPATRVDTATWSRAGQLDWWVKDRQEWFGRVRGADGHQRVCQSY
jgi:hypothetical protein